MSSSNIAKGAIALLLAVMVSAILYFENSIHRDLNESFYQRLEQVHSAQNSIYLGEIDDNRRFLYFLLDTPPIQGIARAEKNDGIDPQENTQLDVWRARLSTIFRSMLYSYEGINQIRLIDAHSGMEMVRVERQLGQVITVPDSKLQDKSQHDYYVQALQLSERTIYSTVINLNREHGKVVTPFQPTKRFTLPTYDIENDLFGVLVINTNAEKIVNRIVSQAPDIQKVMILGTDDSFIYHPEFSLRYSKDLNPEISFQTLYSVTPWFDKVQLLEEKQTGEQFLALISKVEGGNFNDLNVKLVNLISFSEYQQSLNEKRLTTYVLLAVACSVFALIFFAFWQYTSSLRVLDSTRAEFKAILDGASDGVLGFDTNLKLTSFNASAKHFFKQLNSSRLGSNSQFLPEAVHQFLFHYANLVLKGEMVESKSLQLDLNANETIWLSLSLSPIYAGNERIQGVALFVEDTTAKKEAEAQLVGANERLEQEVKERTKELVHARDKAAKASEVKSAFISTISHEMRTPLNGILGSLNLVRKEPVTKQQHKYLEMMETSSSTLLSLINDVLDLSKIEAGKLDIDNEPFNPLSVIEHVALSMSAKAKEQKIAYIVDQTGLEHIELCGDAARVKQIIYNLLSNAIKFTKKGHVKLSVTTEQLDDTVWLKVIVEDTGVGIEKANHSKLFQSFSQESASTSNEFGGTGLGLSICKQLVEKMLGHIHFESEKFKGSKFWFELPFSSAQTKPINVPEVLAGKTVSVLSKTKLESDTIAKLIAKCGGEYVEKGADSDICIITNEQDYIQVKSVKNQFEKLILVGDKLQHINDSDNIVHISDPLRIGEFVALFDLNKAIRLQPSLKKSGDTVALSGNLVTGCHFLVVDDNQINRIVAKGILEGQGAKVSFAVDGQDAVNKLLLFEHQEVDFDAIFMDCNMPGMDGYQATRAIRQGQGGDKYKDAIVIAMTASALAGEKERCLNAGMDEFVTKPVVVEQLFKVLDALGVHAKGDDSVLIHPFESEEEEQATQPINEADVLERLSGDKELLKKLYTLFLSDSENQMQQLRLSIKNSNCDASVSYSHALKGQAGDLAAETLFDLLDKIEAHAREHQAEQCKSHLEQAQSEYDKVVVFAKKRLSELEFAGISSD
ncbi:hybrid sensor histidine kinase/response regulator [Pseudoalteromonas sp. GCY]|uniref:ATP-binding protein n=1 Tax=Pseudoalteromonas sp. GCY TaxID=2003316 RepID=UPI000BFEE537|nr:ATP-binding protein [Pseudoalteromonas sp. GCY]PHI37801.1 hybrid sensor histidine kinase/response regulator [Pseudoalteromonas sp. GCY]QQQ64925.1 response regulator [Pseudoalteromonas sp. GCY]